MAPISPNIVERFSRRLAAYRERCLKQQEVAKLPREEEEAAGREHKEVSQKLALKEKARKYVL